MHFNAKFQMQELEARINSLESDVFAIKQTLGDILDKLDKLDSNKSSSKKKKTSSKKADKPDENNESEA